LDLESTVLLGTHHEQQHQELVLTDLKHAFANHPEPPTHGPAQTLTRERGRPWDGSFRLFEGGLTDVGHGGRGFAFDNEQPRHRVFVAPFRLATGLVSSGQCLEFVEDGGYRNSALWLADGWDRVQRERWQAPLYWRRESD